MSAIVSSINALHVLLAAGFVLVTFALLGVTLVNRVRVRNAVISWRSGSWKTVPYGPLAFLLLIMAFEGIALASGRSIPLLLLSAYAAGTIAWFAAAYISSFVVVSECGIIADIHRREACVAWGRIADYFEFDRGRRSGFVFLYRDDLHEQSRLEIEVPDRYKDQLSEIVDMQLRRRFERSDRRARGKTALEG